MRWSSRLGDPQAGLPLVHHSGGLNFLRLRCGPQSSDNRDSPYASRTIAGNEYLTGKGCAVAGPPLQCLGALRATEWVNW